MFCSKCGFKIDEKSNFCGKCGTKVDSGKTDVKVEKPTNVNSLDSFIENISKKTDKQSVDSDIFTKIDEAESNSGYIKKKKSWFQELFSKDKKAKAKSKPKAKPRPRPKSKPKSKQKSKPKSKSVSRPRPKKSEKTSSRNINMKVLIPAILAPAVIVIGVFAFIFFKGKAPTPNNDVAKAFKATLEKIEKHAEKTKQMPDLSSDKKDAEAKIFEKERYLKIKNASGGLLNENVLGSLNGMSIKSNEKQDIERDLFNAKLTFANDKNEEIFAEVFSSPELVTLELPSLYHSNLGMHFKQADNNNNDTENKTDTDNDSANAAVPETVTPYYDEVSRLLELLKNGESSFNIFKDSIKEKSGTLVSDIIKNAEFKLVNENEQSNEKEYSTVLENKALLESLKTFLTQINEEDFNKNLQLLLSYFTKGQTLELTKLMALGSTDEFIAGIDNTIKELTPNEPEKTDSQESKEAGVSLGEIAGDTSKKVAKKQADEQAKTETIVTPKETELRLIIDENQTIRNISFSIVIDGVLVAVEIDIEESESTLNVKANVKMSKDNRHLTLDILSLTDELGSGEIKRGSSASLITFLDDKLVLDSTDIYNSKTGIYSSKINAATNDKNGEFLFNYGLSGKYNEEGESKKLDIDSLKIDIDDGLYKFNLEFIGHMLKRSTNSIESTNSNNVIFIDNMPASETDGIKEEISKNWKEFLERFRNKKW